MNKMKSIVCLLLVLLSAGIRAQELSRTIHLEVPGTLPDSITSTEKNQITNLILSGDFNGTDIRFIREMAGADAQGKATEGKLAVLDMGNANIVAGGDTYYESYKTSDQIVGAYMFFECKFSTLIIPENTIEISNQGFYNCTGLTAISIPENVLSIGERAFENCISLFSVVIPANVIQMGRYSFLGCLLKEYYLSDSDVELQNDGTFVSYDLPVEKLYLGRNISGSFNFRYKKTLKEVTISDHVTSPISVEAFSGCISLVSVSIGGGVTYIDNYAFADCTSLKKIRLEDGKKNLKLSRNSVFNNSPIEKLYLGRNLIGESLDLGNSSVSMEVTIGSQVTFLSNRLFYGNKGLKAIEIPANVDSIAGSAFYGCTSLRSVRFMDSKTGIRLPEINTFQSCPIEKLYLGRNILEESTLLGNCQDLKEVIIGNDVTFINRRLFQDCMNLETVILSNNIDSIASTAFYNCKKITSITIPSNVTSIGASAFSGCNLDTVFVQRAEPIELLSSIGLEDKLIYVPSGSEMAYRQTPVWNKSIIKGDGEAMLEIQVQTPGTMAGEIVKAGMRSTYVGRLKLGGTLNNADWEVIRTDMNCLYDIDMSDLTNTEIPNNIFENKKLLLSVILPAHVETLGNRLFSGCSNMKGEIVFPVTLKSIGIYAFSGTAFSSVQFTGENCSIKEGAFFECQSLGSVRFSGKYSIGTAAFKKSAITSLEPLNGLTWIGSSAFEECRRLKGTIELYGIKELPQSVFYNCDSIQTVILPKEISQIRIQAFMGCSQLENISWPDFLEIIETNSFANCEKLKMVNLPEGIKQLEDGAFVNCKGLMEVKVHKKIPLTISTKVFEGVNYSKCTLYVPKNSKDSYLLAKGWQNFANILEGDYYGYNVLSLVCGKNGKIIIGEQEVTNAKLDIKIYEGTHESCKLLLIPDEGCEIKTVLLGEKNVTSDVTDSEYTVPDISGDISFSVIFALKQYNVETLVAAGEGEIRINRQDISSIKANYGDKVVFDLIPANDCEIIQVTLNEKDVTDKVLNNQFTINKVTENLSLTVKFRKKMHQVTTDIVGNGQVEINGSIASGLLFEKGTLIRVVVLPDEGYECSKFMVGEFDLIQKIIDNGEWTTEINEDLSIHIEFRDVSSISSASNCELQVQGDKLILSGLSLGEMVKVYSITSGILLKTINVTESVLKITLPASGIYLINIGDKSYKVKI